MRKKFIKAGIVAVLTYVFYVWVKAVGIYSRLHLQGLKILKWKRKMGNLMKKKVSQ